MKALKKQYWKTAMILTVIFIFAASQGIAAEAVNGTQSEGLLQLKPFKVSARKSEQDAQDVSASISAFDGPELSELGVTNLTNLPMFVPNLGFQQIGTHYTEFNYRGIGGVTTMGKTWNINVDGVTIPYVGLDTLFDVERIEVMRGGQGALYGRNTHAGVINIITRSPSEENTGELEGAYSSFNSRRVTGTVSGPLGEEFKYRLAFQHRASDGWMKNEVTNDDRSDWGDQVSGHGRLYYKPNDDTDVTFSLIADTYAGNNDGWANIATGNTFKSTSDFKGKDDGGLLSGQVTLNHDFGESKLTSISAFSNSRYITGVDMDVSPMPMINLNDYKETYNTFTQEVRLASTETEGLRWMTGMFMISEHTDFSTNVESMMGDAGSKSSVKTIGGAWFGQLVYEIFDGLELDASLRLDVEQRAFDWEDANSSKTHSETHTWFAPMPSATLTYAFNDNHRIYGSVSRGYRTGDYNANEVHASTIKQKCVVNPEYTLTYEAGYKGLTFDKRLSFNTSIFYIDWTDMQVSSIIDGLQVRDNAGKAHSYGFEADVNWLAAKGLNLFGNVGWLNAEFDEYDGHPAGDLKGNKIPNTNEYSVGAGVMYHHDSGFFGTVAATWFGPKYMESTNTIKQNSYTLANAKIGYRAENWNLAVFADNILDEEYLVRAYQTGPGLEPGRYGKPRSFGIEGGLNF